MFCFRSISIQIFSYAAIIKTGFFASNLNYATEVARVLVEAVIEAVGVLLQAVKMLLEAVRML